MQTKAKQQKIQTENSELRKEVENEQQIQTKCVGKTLEIKKKQCRIETCRKETNTAKQKVRYRER